MRFGIYKPYEKAYSDLSMMELDMTMIYSKEFEERFEEVYENISSLCNGGSMTKGTLKSVCHIFWMGGRMNVMRAEVKQSLYNLVQR